MEITVIEPLINEKCFLSVDDFNAIVCEIQLNSNCIQQCISEMLDMMNQIKYQHTIQINAKKYMNEINQESCTETVVLQAVRKINKKERVTICSKPIKNVYPKSETVQSNVNKDPRFKKIWMTEYIYQLIQARRRFSMAVKLHPESSYLRAQHRFYELSVYDAVDKRKKEFYSRKYHKSLQN